MKTNKCMLAFGILLCAIAIGLSVRSVRAGDRTVNGDLAHELATKFHLNESEVEDFLDNYNREENKDQVSSHIEFIDAKLKKGVTDKWLTESQKKDVMVKLRQMMQTTPSSQQFARMTATEQQRAINTWKKEMSIWARQHNTTIELIRNLIGKGNKYLMGIEQD